MSTSEIIEEQFAALADDQDADTSDTSDTSESGEPAAGESAQDAAPADETPAADAASAKTEDLDELAEHLKELKIDRKKRDGRDNPIPYSNVQRILANAKKKLQADFETWKSKEYAPHSDFLQHRQAIEQRLRDIQMVDQLIAQDPAAYIRALAKHHPDKYGQFAALLDTQKPVDPADLMPEPDTPEGWTMDGVKKLITWVEGRATKRGRDEALQDIEQKYGKVLRDAAARQAADETRPKIRAQVERARSKYGEQLFDANVAALNDYWRQRPDLTFQEVCEDFLLPKMRVNEDELRVKIAKDLQERAKGARRVVGGGKSATREAEDRSSRSIIADKFDELDG